MLPGKPTIAVQINTIDIPITSIKIFRCPQSESGIPGVILHSLGANMIKAAAINVQ